MKSETNPISERAHPSQQKLDYGFNYLCFNWTEGPSGNEIILHFRASLPGVQMGGAVL